MLSYHLDPLCSCFAVFKGPLQLCFAFVEFAVALLEIGLRN